MATKLSSRAPKNGSPWLNVKQAAARLGVGVDAIYEAMSAGKLRHAKLGHSTIRIRVEWLDEYGESFEVVNDTN